MSTFLQYSVYIEKLHVAYFVTYSDVENDLILDVSNLLQNAKPAHSLGIMCYFVRCDKICL